MNLQEIEQAVEAYLNHENSILQVDVNQELSAYERFQLRTVKRLKRAFDLYGINSSYQNDFLLALRDYLLVFKTKIRLDQVSVPENDFAIVRDEQTGEYFCTYQFPDYVTAEFIKQAFLDGWHEYNPSVGEFDLLTDPMIYKTTGYIRFKSIAQKIAVYGALNTPDGYTTLVSLPTGGGKSLITQTMAYQKDGLTIVVMPTVSLAIDQVRTAKKTVKTNAPEQEIFAYYGGVNSKPILDAIRSRTAKMLFISPESLMGNAGFNDVINEANKTRYLKNIIVDEAHIVVDWGASFRVDYQCLESWRTKLMLTNPSIRTVLLSATYDRRCVEILRDFFSRNDKWIEIRCDSLRHEPRFMLVRSKSHASKAKKILELVKKLPHPMIIYVAKPDEAVHIQNFLRENGIRNVETFTGETTGARRKELIDSWVNDRFEIMVATSAFGVGVDKSDVRTVLHAYIPPNANAYYQELGRGGRDKLPCLSVMCTQPEDLNTSFQRISKKVLTVEKIEGRWDSMYNSKDSKRKDNLIFMDTSIKPSYNVVDPFDDAPSTDADQNWNVYVLLLLRRHNLIRIQEVMKQGGKYIFLIEILDDALRNNDLARYECLEATRQDEWESFNSAFQLMKHTILHSQDTCWSEMFFETYDKVSEYCAGCNAHSVINEGDYHEFPLKLAVKKPVREINAGQLALFGQAKEAAVVAGEDIRQALFNSILNQRLSVLVGMGDIQKYIEVCPYNRNVMILDQKELWELMKKSNYYYVSGLVAVVYAGSEKDILDQFKMVSRYLRNKTEIRLLHIIPNNVYFSSLGKNFCDVIEGPVVTADQLYS